MNRSTLFVLALLLAPAAASAQTSWPYDLPTLSTNKVNKNPIPFGQAQYYQSASELNTSNLALDQLRRLYELRIFIPGQPAAGQLVFAHIFPRSVTFAVNWGAGTSAAPQGWANVSPASPFTFTVKQLSGGTTTTIGTLYVHLVSILGGGMVQTWAWTLSSATTFAPGDVMLIYAQGTQDTALSDIAITLCAAK